MNATVEGALSGQKSIFVPEIRNVFQVSNNLSVYSKTMGHVCLDDCGNLWTFRLTVNPWLWITRISYPVFLAIGTLGNLLGVMVVCGDQRGSKRTFLLGLFLADLWFLWNRFIIYLGSKVWSVDQNQTIAFPYGNASADGDLYVKTAGIWIYVESVLFFSAQWIMLAFCMDRYFAVIRPMQHYVENRRKTLWILAFIYFASAVNALYIPVAYYSPPINSDHACVSIAHRCWRRIEIWWEVIIRLLTYSGTAWLNFSIIAQLRTTANQSSLKLPKLFLNFFNSRSSPTLTRNQIHRSKSQKSANKLLLSSSFFFLITQSLDFVMSVLVVFSQSPICMFHITDEFMHVYNPLRDFLVNLYFTFEFVFYLCFGANLCGRLQASFTTSDRMPSVSNNLTGTRPWPLRRISTTQLPGVFHISE